MARLDHLARKDRLHLDRKARTVRRNLRRRPRAARQARPQPGRYRCGSCAGPRRSGRCARLAGGRARRRRHHQIRTWRTGGRLRRSGRCHWRRNRRLRGRSPGRRRRRPPGSRGTCARCGLRRHTGRRRAGRHDAGLHWACHRCTGLHWAGRYCAGRHRACRHRAGRCRSGSRRHCEPRRRSARNQIHRSRHSRPRRRGDSRSLRCARSGHRRLSYGLRPRSARAWRHRLRRDQRRASRYRKNSDCCFRRECAPGGRQRRRGGSRAPGARHSWRCCRPGRSQSLRDLASTRR